MYPGREALLPGPGSGSKQVGKSPVTKVSGGAKTSGPKWMHTLMCVNTDYGGSTSIFSLYGQISQGQMADFPAFIAKSPV